MVGTIFGFSIRQIIWSAVSLLLAVVAIWFGWHKFTEQYVNVGRAEVRAEWTNQKLADSKAAVARSEKLRALESLNRVQMATIENQQQESQHNENIARDRTIAAIRTGALRLRPSPQGGNPKPDAGVPVTIAGTGSGNAAKGIELPTTPGEDAIRVGSEANEVADQLRACQQIIIEDRRVCNGKP